MSALRPDPDQRTSGEQNAIENAAAPRCVVGPLALVLINVNGMIGAGIFATPAILYSTLGSFAP